MATTNATICAIDGLELGPEDQGQHAGDRQPQHDHDDLPTGERSDVVVDRVERARQVARQLALADPLLPTERREHDVHVADQRPHDVVGGERGRRVAADRSPLLTGDRRPDHEVHHGFGDHPDHVEVVADPVLETLHDRGSTERGVQSADTTGSRSRVRSKGRLPRRPVRRPCRSRGSPAGERQLDHIVDRRVLDRQIVDRLFGQQPGRDRCGLVTSDSQCRADAARLDHLAVVRTDRRGRRA